MAVRLLTLSADDGDPVGKPLQQLSDDLDARLGLEAGHIQRAVSERRCSDYFGAGADKLDGWADDLKFGLEREIKEIDRQIKEARRAATGALTLEEKLAGQKQIKSLEALRNAKRRNLFEAQDEIDRQRADLIRQIEAKLEQKIGISLLFTIRWILN